MRIPTLYLVLGTLYLYTAEFNPKRIHTWYIVLSTWYTVLRTIPYFFSSLAI
jgi:hypothetical protein